MSQPTESKRIGYKISSAIAFFLLFAINLTLLFKGYLNGSEFVAFFVAMAMFCTVPIIFPNIKELSIAGNTIKLKETLNEAEKLIKSIESVRILTVKHYLKTLAKQNSRLDSEHCDSRLDDFIEIYEEVKNSQKMVCIAEFKKCGAILVAQGIRRMKELSDFTADIEVKTADDFRVLEEECILGCLPQCDDEKEVKNEIKHYVNNMIKIHKIINDLESVNV